MKLRKNLQVIILLILPFAMSAQQRDLASPWSVKLQYVGEFVLHPGFSLGTDYTIRSNHWFNLHWDTELGGYSHKRNNNAVYLQTTLGTRFTVGFSLFADLQAGIGFMAAVPQGDVYRVDETGHIHLGGRPVTTHFKPGFSFLMGWDGARNRNLRVRVFTGFEAYMQSGYNHVMLPHAAFRLGVAYQL